MPGAPNVLFVVLDDTGFGHLGCYGSPIRTPNLDRLAAGGLLFNNMHTTALCSPSRACISNGRNHHSNAMSCITEGATGYPGGDGMIPLDNGFLSEILVTHGYSTFALGKWHLTPIEQTSPAGPYDRWPLGRGFERFYGFMGGDTHQYYPDLISDNHQIRPPKTPEEGYHLTEDLVDRATIRVPSGAHELRFEFEPTEKPDIPHGKGAPGKAQLYIDGKLAGETQLPFTIPLDIGITQELSCGRDGDSTVSDAYKAPFRFTGKLESVAVDVSGDLIVDHEAAMRSIMAHQ